jgi:hypothetical protein
MEKITIRKEELLKILLNVNLMLELFSQSVSLADTRTIDRFLMARGNVLSILKRAIIQGKEEDRERKGY